MDHYIFVSVRELQKDKKTANILGCLMDRLESSFIINLANCAILDKVNGIIDTIDQHGRIKYM